MFASLARQSIAKKFPQLARQIQDIRYDIFGSLPQLVGAGRKGHQIAKKQLLGTYWEQYHKDSLIAIAKRVRENYFE
jgi:hypothetical protein